MLLQSSSLIGVTFLEISLEISPKVDAPIGTCNFSSNNAVIAWICQAVGVLIVERDITFSETIMCTYYGCVSRVVWTRNSK